MSIYKLGGKDYFKFNFLNNNLMLEYLINNEDELIFDKEQKILVHNIENVIELNNVQVFEDDEMIRSEFTIDNENYFIVLNENKYLTNYKLLNKPNELKYVGFFEEEINPLRISNIINTIKDSDNIKNIIINSDKVLKTNVDCIYSNFKKLLGNNYFDLLNLNNCYLLLMNKIKTQFISFDLKDKKTYLFQNNDIYLIDNNSSLESTDNQIHLLFSNKNHIFINDEPESYTHDMQFLNDKYDLIAILNKLNDEDEQLNDENLLKTVTNF